MKSTPGVHALLYSGDLLAVDLGTFAVKVLSLKARERSLTVLASARKEVWRELAEAKSDDEKTAVYASALRELLRGDFKPRNASIALPGSSIVLRFLTLPEGGQLNPEKGLSAEARALIPFDEAEPPVSTMVTPGVSGRLEAILAAAPSKTVRGAMDVVRRAGLRPAVVVNDGLALADACRFFSGRKLDETVLAVNVGATSTSAVVIENGIPRTARVFNIAGNSFTRAVKREFSVELEEAETLKVAHGLEVSLTAAPEEKAAAARVAAALAPLVKDLGAEILRTVDVFLARRPADAPPIARVLLAGGSAELKGLSESLAASTGMTVDVFRPMVNVAGKDGGDGIKALESASVVACGLALSNTLLRASLRPRLNLVPKRARRAAILRDVSPRFGRKLAAPVLVGLGICLYGWWAVDVSRKEAETEKRLQAAAQAAAAARQKAAKPKAAPSAPKKPADPYAYLGRLSVSGVFGSGTSGTVMLGNYTARDGKLYDGEDRAVSGVTSAIGEKSVSLTAGGKSYVIALPK